MASFLFHNGIAPLLPPPALGPFSCRAVLEEGCSTVVGFAPHPSHCLPVSGCWVPCQCPLGLPDEFAKRGYVLPVGMHGLLITLLHSCFPYKMSFVKNRHCSIFGTHATRRYMKKRVDFSVKELTSFHAIHITLSVDQFYMHIELR